MSNRAEPVFSKTDKAAVALGCSGCMMLFASIGKTGLGCLIWIIGLVMCGAIFGGVAGG